MAQLRCSELSLGSPTEQVEVCTVPLDWHPSSSQWEPKLFYDEDLASKLMS